MEEGGTATQVAYPKSNRDVVDLDVRDGCGQTALYVAAYKGASGCVAALLMASRNMGKRSMEDPREVDAREHGVDNPTSEPSDPNDPPDLNDPCHAVLPLRQRLCVNAENKMGSTPLRVAALQVKGV